MNFLLPAFVLGILGSAHCIGMCGPLMLAMPFGNRNSAALPRSLIYNFGRMVTYGLLGLVFGIFGKSFFVSGLQQALSIFIGVLIILFFFLPSMASFGNKLKSSIEKFLNPLYSRITNLSEKSNFMFYFLSGMINGLLPCGLVYTAIAGAIVSGAAWNGALFMILFGAGTLPAMISVAMFNNSIKMKWRFHLKKVFPVTMLLMALLLILRGLNLGIPYLSPKTHNNQQVTGSCCTQRPCSKSFK
jgi:uncharacterized protein